MTGSGVAVQLSDLRRRFGVVLALDGPDLELAPGELVTLLGPSGCGKTTALRVLAGLEDADSGRVRVDGRDITTVPANKRDMGMVFQAYSLFPHLTARQNVEFGMRLRGRPAAERGRTAADLLDLVGIGTPADPPDLVGIGPHADRSPHRLPGGQQQRVALARALAIRPKVLLLDEPLSALDARVRAQLREEIRRIQLEVGTTAVFVTHDQEEALAVADEVGVMSAGRLEQLAAPQDVYDRPATPFVAEFVGLTSRVPAVAQDGLARTAGGEVPLLPGSAEHGNVELLVRPEAVVVSGDESGTGASGRVVHTSFLGALARITL